MVLKNCVEYAFGTDANIRVPAFLQKRELFDCSNDTARWYGLYKKCQQWQNKFLLWERRAYVVGIHGWNMEVHTCELRLPEESADWTAYLYRMTALVIVRGLDADYRKQLADAGLKMENFLFALGRDYYVSSGYWELTREQWLDEISSLLVKSKKRYDAWDKNNREYLATVAKNYPILEYVLRYLAQNVGDCEIVRMNQHGGDETVWYFVKTKKRFYLMFVSDSLN